VSKAVDVIRKWRKNPRSFVIDNFKITPDAWQDEFLMALGSNDINKRRISLQACAGPGKSAALAWAGLWFLTCMASKGEHPKGAVVAVTRDNLRDNIFPELSKWMNRSEFLMKAFEWTKERLSARDHPETWFLSARSWSKTADEEEQGRTLSGLHSSWVLYLIDESRDIPPAVLKSAEQGLSNCEWGKIIQAGNPTSLDGMLYAASTTLRDKWHIICITGDPDDPMRSPRIDIEWARDQISKYGRQDPWVMSYILGKFPPSSINSLVSLDEVDIAMKRQLRHDQFNFSQKRLGIDCARFGTDSTVIFPRQGLFSGRPVDLRGARSEEIAARVMTAKNNWGSEIEIFDGTGGYGAGAIDAMLQGGGNPLEVNFSGKATDSRYFNKRSEMYFLMAEWIKRGGHLPNIPQLRKELPAMTYTFQNGKFRLEEKDQIKKRLGFSPDFSDALALTFALPEMPAANAYELHKSQSSSGKMLSEYDPYSPDRQ
jgi:phage terminase large subunit